MKQNDALDKLVNNSFGGALNALTDLPSQPEKKRRTKEQVRTVGENQNRNRKGQGKKLPAERTTVSFKVAKKIASDFQDIHYTTGKTLTELYEEAMLFVIKKYQD